MVCRCLLAPRSATIHTIQALHSQRHTLPDSHNMARSPLLSSHLLQYRRLVVLPLQVLFPAHLSRSTSSSQVTADPTRNGTGDVIPLAEAITQLSFLEFLQRFGVSIASPQPSRPPLPISLQDATVQTTPSCDVSQEVSTQTSDQQDTLSCNVAVQTAFHGAHTATMLKKGQIIDCSMGKAQEGKLTAALEKKQKSKRPAAALEKDHKSKQTTA